MAKAKKKVIKKITKKPEAQQAVQQQNVQAMQTTQQQQQQIKLVANNQFCSIIHSSFFNETQCNALVKSLVEELWTTGKTVGGGVNKKIRSVEQQVLPMNNEGWPLTRILEFAQQANNARFKFDLSGFLDVDAPVIMRYSKGGHYDWHVDSGNEVCHRKLSFSIQLSDSKDYEGGDIEFLGTKVKTDEFRQKGMAIIFPSFLPHRITKVTKGVRHAIVGWIHGPTFK